MSLAVSQSAVSTAAPGRRIVIVGTAGAGKTTLATQLAAEFGLPRIELDALHWAADWRALSVHDPHEFIRRVEQAVAGPDWVLDGNYGMVRTLAWSRATHLVWLDYDRTVIMVRVIRRTLVRALCRTELWAGNRERWRTMLRPSHPIRWAWSTWRRRRGQMEQLLQSGEHDHLKVIRLRQPAEARTVPDRLRDTADN